VCPGAAGVGLGGGGYPGPLRSAVPDEHRLVGLSGRGLRVLRLVLVLLVLGGVPAREDRALPIEYHFADSHGFPICANSGCNNRHDFGFSIGSAGGVER
jgi:hypothetical protein